VTVTRAVQLSAFPDHKPHRPTGKILASVQTGLNADLIAAVAPLYLTGSVLDMTYGKGAWWVKFRPVELIAHDLDPSKGDGVDFRALPEGDNSVDTACFDPPYLPQGSDETSTAGAFLESFGLVMTSRADLWDLFDAGLAEGARVARKWLLVKCCDFVNGGAFHLGHRRMMDMGEAHGLKVHDLIVHHAGSGPGGHNIFEVQRARRNHSYLIAFDASRSGPPVEGAA
jgi:hypothetical protein